MVNEVESILNEIRKRVRADHEQGVPDALVVSDETVKDSLADPAAKSESENSESLGRLSAHLTTTARAWDQLPPMFSNRKGGAGRVEMWLKARLKALSRWFTWEQVNFNSAVHYALSETLNTLLAYEQQLALLRAELVKETEARRQEYEAGNRELATLQANLDAQAAEIRKRDANLGARSAAIEVRAAEMAAGVATEVNAAREEIDAARTEMTSRLAGLAGELRESDEQLREEQRVCFKQLSLEASESAVTGDRARRLIEPRLAKLEKAVSNGEK